jgi:hypothetical protein
MDLNARTTLETVLAHLETIPRNTGLFLIERKPWGLTTAAAVVDLEEYPDAVDESPAHLANEGLVYCLLVSTVKSILRNARLQRPSLSQEDAVKAIAHYHENDAYIQFS